MHILRRRSGARRRVPMASRCLPTAIAAFLCAVAAGAHADDRRPVEIKFAAQVNGKPAACAETYHDVGTSKAALFLQDFRIYVSAVRLIAKDGREVPLALTPDEIWQGEKVALLDFENGAGNCNGNAPTNESIKGTVPAGEYRGVVFEIGVPFELNHQDPTLAAAPLNYSALTWPWSIGYKFTTIDFDTEPASERKMLSLKGMHATGRRRVSPCIWAAWSAHRAGRACRPKQAAVVPIGRRIVSNHSTRPNRCSSWISAHCSPART